MFLELRAASRILIIQLLLSPLCPAQGVWELRRDDVGAQNQRPAIQDGTVTISPGDGSDTFPRYLNEIGVERIRIRFSTPTPGERRLTAVWNGGTMGPDGFDVRLDGEWIGGTGPVDTARLQHMWHRSEIHVPPLPAGEHVIEISSPPDLHSAVEFAGLQLAAPNALPYSPLCYESVASLERYEEMLGERGTLAESPHIRLFAPRRFDPAARELCAFLERACEQFAAICGRDMLFTFSVEHFLEGHPRGWGGISGQATIGYPISALERFAQMRTADVRGVAGYTEEMSHAFLNLHGCAGTYEALGRAVQEDVLRRLLPRDMCDAFWLPEHRQWAETHQAYLAAGRRNPDPQRYPWNVLYTRILNDVFRQLREERGPELWPEFFATIRDLDYPLNAASPTERMGIYADIFGRIFGRDVRSGWESQGIDLGADPPWGWQTHSPPS